MSDHINWLEFAGAFFLGIVTALVFVWTVTRDSDLYDYDDGDVADFWAGEAGMKRIYLSGPMSGIPEHNFPLFNSEAARLRSYGYEVVNPVDVNPDVGASWEDCLRRDLAELLTCDSIALLPGWQASRGALLELHVAQNLGFKIVGADEVLA